MNRLYDECFDMLIGHEGGFTDDARDRGNWTSGVIGRGELRGTKYGISAMSYPHEDIRNLTLKRAKELYKRDYWDAMMCDDLPPGLAFVTFDTAVNSGTKRAGQFLAGAGNALDFMAARLDFLTQIATWPTYGKGWAKRCAAVLQQASNLDRKYAPPTLGEPEPLTEVELLYVNGHKITGDVVKVTRVGRKLFVITQ